MWVRAGWIRRGNPSLAGNSSSLEGPRMAKRFAYFSPAIALGIFLLVGCQQQQTAPLVQNIPSPSFNGPTIAPPPAAPKAPTPAPPPVASAAGPKAWIPTAPVRAWKWIIVHHSASPTGNAAI